MKEEQHWYVISKKPEDNLEKIRKIIEYRMEKDSRKQGCLKILEDLKEQMLDTPASTHFHHHTRGGLIEHTLHVIIAARDIFSMLKQEGYYIDDIDMSNLTLVSFIHDLGKMGTYATNIPEMPGGYRPPVFSHKENVDTTRLGRTLTLCAAYGIVLTGKELNALENHEGGWSATQHQSRPHMMTRLAYILHIADLIGSQFKEYETKSYHEEEYDDFLNLLEKKKKREKGEEEVLS